MALNGAKARTGDRTEQREGGRAERMTYKEQGERSFRFRRSANHVTCKLSATAAAADCVADNINKYTETESTGGEKRADIVKTFSLSQKRSFLKVLEVTYTYHVVKI